MLGGQSFIRGNKPQSIVNLRSSVRAGRFTVYGEVMWRDPSGQDVLYRRWAIGSFITGRITRKVSVGVENDLFLEPGLRPSVGVGPRLSVKIGKRSVVTPAFQFRRDRYGGNLFRIYLLHAL